MSDAPAPEEKLSYRLITGPDDRAISVSGFPPPWPRATCCTAAPPPRSTAASVIVAQALILPAAIASADAAVATAVEDLEFDGEGHA